MNTDKENGVMLLEKLITGIHLEEQQNLENAVVISVEVMNKLHQAKYDASFPSLANWFKGFENLYKYFGGNTGPFPSPIIDRAKKWLASD